jgi:hypothetical protein
MKKDSAKTPYMQKLLNDFSDVQLAIDGLLRKYKVVPAGNGYLDLILNPREALALVDELARLPVAVRGMSWWCLCTPESKLKLGCPHGYGGPVNTFDAGWFSECGHYPDFLVDEHGLQLDEFFADPNVFVNQAQKLISGYIQDTLPIEPFFSPCLHPGLWLYVPDDWERKH